MPRCQAARRHFLVHAAALTLALALGACGGGGDGAAADGRAQPLAAPKVAADIVLAAAGASAVLSSDSAWSLNKTGSLSGSTVTWNIVATQTATTSGHLVIQGQMTVTNAGTAPATIGNIVVNLQKKSGSNWTTKASDVANATEGDAATTAKIHAAASSENKSSFTESSASGALEFMDATNNTLFSLVPQALIAPGATRTLLFSASFNNNDAALQLTAGTQVRAEVIVSFGNATSGGNSTANVDINGNGTIDADEARVRSVPSRLTVTVPAAVNGDATPTLTDALSDIVTTGTASVSNVSFNLGATSGTVTATVAGGTTGGTVTNCAHLTTQTVSSGGSTFTLVPGLDLQSCSTVQVGAVVGPCTPGSANCAWKTNDMTTYGQTPWGTGSSTAGVLLNANFGALYGSNFVVGGGYTITFSIADAVFAYLPDSSGAGVLNSSLFNPTSTAAGELVDCNV